MCPIMRIKVTWKHLDTGDCGIITFQLGRSRVNRSAQEIRWFAVVWYPPPSPPIFTNYRKAPCSSSSFSSSGNKQHSVIAMRTLVVVYIFRCHRLFHDYHQHWFAPLYLFVVRLPPAMCMLCIRDLHTYEQHRTRKGTRIDDWGLCAILFIVFH